MGKRKVSVRKTPYPAGNGAKIMEFFNLSFNNMILFLIMFIPGFVSMKVWSLIVPSRNRKMADYVLEAVSYSIFNFAILFWLINLISGEGFQENNPFLFYVSIFLIFFLFPSLWPFLIKYLLESSETVRRIFLNPTPTAWDHFFGKEEPCFILFHLRDGKMIGGLYTDGSFSSSFPNQQDIYISEVWRVNEDGEFIEKVDQTMGMLIRRSKVDYMEFFTVDEIGEINPKK